MIRRKALAWGDEGVTKLLYKQDSNQAWGPINSPVTTQLIKSGILKDLRLISNTGTQAFAGATTASLFGPFNSLSDITVLANAQQTVYKASGIGGAQIDNLVRGLEYDDAPANSELPSGINPTDTSFIFNGRQTTAGNNPSWTWSVRLPTSQEIRSLGGDIGLIPMSTENAQLTLSYTPTATSVAAGTYTINSAADDLSQPYFGANAVTIPSPAIDIFKKLYEPVISESDFPDFSFVNQWVEERPQTFGTNGFTWKQNQDAGVILRLLFSLFVSTNPWGISTANLNRTDALVLSYNTDIVKFRESGIEALTRQREQLGYSLDLGWFFYDLLGKDLTLADVLNSYIVPAIQLQLNTSSAITLNTTVPPKVIVQRLIPIRVQ
jgi:hypothetical protein